MNVFTATNKQIGKVKKSQSNMFLECLITFSMIIYNQYIIIEIIQIYFAFTYLER